MASQKRKHSPEFASTQDVFRSSAIEDRSSTFIGFFSPSMKPKELQMLKEIKPASHKMLAWRRESNQQSITGATKFTTDSDDDGEKYGGKRIAKVLDSMHVVGACVVARWYGGVLLGPVRFEHIENCAKEAVQMWKDSVAEEQSKKRKTEQDAAETKRLVKVLAERDESIVVLRQLATEKEEKIKKAKAADGDGLHNGEGSDNDHEAAKTKSSASDSKPLIDYAGTSVERLKILEKARDATLSFLLKRIDKAEVELVGITGKIPDI
jgi:putative IMPACT (imprinted ancient) family translation regulator